MEERAKEILLEKLEEMAEVTPDAFDDLQGYAALWQTCTMQFVAVLIKNNPERIIKLIDN